MAHSSDCIACLSLFNQAIWLFGNQTWLLKLNAWSMEHGAWIMDTGYCLFKIELGLSSTGSELVFFKNLFEALILL